MDAGGGAVVNQRRDAEGKRSRILALLMDGVGHSTGEVAHALDTSGPGALYLLRGLEGRGLVRCIRDGREWVWHRPYAPLDREDVEGMP